MLPGYNTNGFAHHRLEDAINILAELGCESIALTLDVHHLDPQASHVHHRAEDVGQALAAHRMGVVVETGARFLLDPRRKHQPTLLDPNDDAREVRLKFLNRCMELAKPLGASVISFWSGSVPGLDQGDMLFRRLVESCKAVSKVAGELGMRLAFEPEPGMFIDTMEKYERLYHAVNQPEFGLTLDIGHLQCMCDLPIAKHIEKWKDVLWNVHIEDMKSGVHDHLPFGEGEIDFPPVFAALKKSGYQGGLHIELSRHSHDAVETARRSLAFLKKGIGA